MDRPDLTNVQWRKSRHSADQDTCVELGWANGAISLRDSKNSDGPALVISRTTWCTSTSTLIPS